MNVAESFSLITSLKNMFSVFIWSGSVYLSLLIIPAIVAFLIIKLLTEGSEPGSGLPEEPMELTFVSKILIFIGALIVSRFLSGILTLIITLIVYFKCRKR